MPGDRTFNDAIRTEAELRELMAEPGGLAVGKQLDRLDHHCRSFIALSPFVLVGTVGSGGACDVSPRGDGPGFVLVLDEKTLAIPERPGNRRLDSLLNILETGTVGLLFVVPGFEETLRVNGHASVVRDADVLGRTAVRGRAPAVAIGVEVEECFLHCAKAFKRSGLWMEEEWPERSAFPSLGRIFRDQGAVPGRARRTATQDRGELCQASVLRTSSCSATRDASPEAYEILGRGRHEPGDGREELARFSRSTREGRRGDGSRPWGCAATATPPAACAPRPTAGPLTARIGAGPGGGVRHLLHQARPPRSARGLRDGRR